MNNGLTFSGLQVTQGAFTLGPDSLTLRPGEYLVLMGPSGCGKTTLLKTLAGFLRPEAGEIRLRDRVLTHLPPEARRIGYVPQSGSLFPHLDVRQNIAFGLAYRTLSIAEQAARVERLAGLLGVTHLLDRQPATLSGGEARRVALTRSLVTEPDLLLLDEPLGMLDTPARRELVGTLKTVHEALGTATIHVTHDQDEAVALGGLCGLMRAGRIVQVGPVASVFMNPADPWAAGFLDGRSSP